MVRRRIQSVTLLTVFSEYRQHFVGYMLDIFEHVTRSREGSGCEM